MDEQQNNVNVGAGENAEGSAGLIIGVIVILAIIILGGLYFWNQRADDVTTDQTVESINTQSDSDAAAAIEADLNATDVENLDAELNAS